MRLFVTDGNLRSTLAVVRSLGQEGVFVTVGAETTSSLAGSSRYCRETLRYPSPVEQPRHFQAFLRREMASCPAVLLPMSDITVRLAAEVASELMVLGARWPFPPPAYIAQVQDKRHVLKVARGLGIACPRQLLPEGSAIEDVAPTLRYPVVVKPRFSRYPQHNGWSHGRVQYAHSPAELIALYRGCHSHIPNPLVQEWIDGEGCGVFLLMWKGELKSAFSHRRLREKPPSGGVGVLCESRPLDERLLADCVALLSSLRWHGPAMVEFRVDRSSQPVLMEVNGRFWGSLQLTLDAGANFPAMLYRLALGENVAPCFDYRVGVRSRWLLGDVDHLLLRLLHRRALKQLGFHGSVAQACWEFFSFADPAVRFENPRWHDLGPFWFECGSYLRKRILPFAWSGSVPAREAQPLTPYPAPVASVEREPLART